MKCSKLRIAILTFLLGIISVPIFNQIYQKWNEPFVNVPQVNSETPIYVIVPTEKNGLDNYWLRVGAGGGDSVDSCSHHRNPSALELQYKKK